MREAIKRALLDFTWSNYGFDLLSELAREDPDVGIFDDLAAHIADELLEAQ